MAVPLLTRHTCTPMPAVAHFVDSPSSYPGLYDGTSLRLNFPCPPPDPSAHIELLVQTYSRTDVHLKKASADKAEVPRAVLPSLHFQATCEPGQDADA